MCGLVGVVCDLQYIDDTVKKKASQDVQVFGLALTAFYYLQMHDVVQKDHPWTVYVATC